MKNSKWSDHISRAWRSAGSDQFFELLGLVNCWMLPLKEPTLTLLRAVMLAVAGMVTCDGHRAHPYLLGLIH